MVLSVASNVQYFITFTDEAALLAVFRDSLQQTFGDYGLGSALASFQVKYYNPISNVCMIRCSRDEYRKVKYDTRF
jgi:RNase P/RNase MRP subunit POP5